MKRAFTLIELLVVMGIIGTLGVMSVSSYRALTTGMADRSAVVAAQSFIDLASQRAQVDRAPIRLYFYDELLQKESGDGTRSLVGRGIAFAVRATGRVTGLSRDEGDEIVEDEFGDLDQIYSTDEALARYAKPGSGKKVGTTFYLMDDSGSTFEASPAVVAMDYQEPYVVSGESVTGGEATSGGGEGLKAIRVCGFRKLKGSTPNVGDAYGKSFATLVLPDGYFFSESPPTGVERKRVSSAEIRSTGAASVSQNVYRYKPSSSSTTRVGTAKGRN